MQKHLSNPFNLPNPFNPSNPSNRIGWRNSREHPLQNSPLNLFKNPNLINQNGYAAWAGKLVNLRHHPDLSLFLWSLSQKYQYPNPAPLFLQAR